MTADAVGAAVFAARAQNIAWTVGTSVIRSARSTLIQQGDLAAGVFDGEGRTIALDERLPLLAFSLSPGIAAILEAFGADIDEGDVFLHNDVWYGNLQHADVGVFAPVFAADELVAWIGCRGHWADIGGAVAGTANPDATDVWQEALRIPPVRVARSGGMIDDVWNLVLSNVRLRGLVESDALAQVGACRVGVDAAQRLVAATGGGDAFRSAAAELFACSAAGLDRALESVPAGTYRGSAVFVDDAADGVTEHPIEVAVTVGGPQIFVDFTGTADQVPSMMNAAIGSTTAAALVTVLTLLGSDVRHDHGVLSRVEVAAPEGSMVNARFPAATFGGNKLCEYIGSAILDAFKEALPKRISAEWSRRLSLRVFGTDPHAGQYHEIVFMTYAGGGAVHGLDGYNQPGLMSGGNVVYQDYEYLETRAPIIVRKHEYAADTAGDGRWRGGLGNETVLDHLGEQVVLITTGGGTLAGARGVFGGTDGACNTLEVALADGSVRRMHARERLGPLAPPVTTTQRTGGGGGYGDPAQRLQSARDRDRSDGLVGRSSDG